MLTICPWLICSSMRGWLRRLASRVCGPWKPGVTPVAQFARPPVLTALSAMALAEYTQGRFVLGIGTGPLDWNKQWHGLEVPKPVARMREYIECLRTLWTATTTQPVSYCGEFLQVTDYLRLIPAPYAQ